MKIPQFKKEAARYIDNGMTVKLISAPGIGKSDVVDQLVAEYSKRDGFQWGLSIVMLATQTPPDIMGYLVPGRRTIMGADGVQKEVRVSEYTMPTWMLSTDGVPMNEYKRGIVFFDEYDKADPDVKRATAEILYKRGIGPWQLNKGHSVIAAANRKDDRSGSTKDFDFIINRVAEVEIQADAKAWEEWAVTNGVPNFFIACAMRNPDMVFQNKVPDKQGPWTTPRSYTRNALLLKSDIDEHGRLNIPTMDQEANLREIMSGIVGPATATTVTTWAKISLELPTLEQILADPEGTPVPAKPDACMLAAYEMSSRADPKNLDRIVDYISRFKSEFRMCFGFALMRRQPTLIAQPAMMKKFIPGNKGLINMVATGGA